MAEATETPAPVSEAAIPAADPAPAVSEAPQAAQVNPQAEAAPAESAPSEPVAHEREPTLLEKFDAEQAAKEAKPAETEKTAERPQETEKPAEAKEGAEKAPEPEPVKPFEWEELAIPEGFAKRFDIPEAEVSRRITEFNDIITKDVNPNVKRAELFALHTKAMQDFAEQMAKNQANAWNEYNKAQVLATMADDELGGAGHQTAMGAIARVRDAATKGWSRAQKQELNDFLIATGAGSHRAFLRLLHSAAAFIDEPQIPSFTPQPPPNNGQKPGRKASVLYDNPRSA